MQFSPQQEEGLSKVLRWFRNKTSPVFYFFGFAGTGKTTLAKHFASMIEGDVIFAAFTGKAAHVLRSKGCTNAQTIHSLIYRSRDKSRTRLKDMENQLQLLISELSESGLKEHIIEDHPRVKRLRSDIKKEADNADQPLFVLNHESDIRHASLVIIDECSMVDERMGEDLLSFGIPILVLGDPAQLPPVGGAGYFTENVEPDVMLTEIHRQAELSPILKMATKTRNRIPLEIGDWGEGCSVLPIGTKLDSDTMLSFDQIIVGRNKTRKLTNSKLRSLKLIQDPYPIIGDRLVCLRNDTELGLLNGAIFEVSGITGILDRKVHMSVCPEGELASVEVAVHEHYFLGKDEELQWFEKREAHEFDYGYALTCHKSQGSQWNNVCVFDESFCFKKDRWRWLYTAITRAADQITVVRMKDAS